MRRAVSPVLASILRDFGKTPDGKCELDERKVLEAVRDEPVPAAGAGARVLAHRRLPRRGKADPQPPFNPASGIFTLKNAPKASPGSINPAWVPPLDKLDNKEAKELAGLRFLLDTVYIGIVATTEGYRFGVHLWRRTDDKGNPIMLNVRESFELVPQGKLMVTHAAWPVLPLRADGEKGRVDAETYLKKYMYREPLQAPRPDAPDTKIVTDIRRVLALADAKVKEPAATAKKPDAAPAEDPEEMDVDEEVDAGTVVPLPVPRSRVGAKSASRAALLQQLQAKFPAYVRLSGHMDVSGHDTLDAPADMKAEFAQLNVIPVRMGYAQTMGPSQRWVQSPLLNANGAHRANYALQTGRVTLAGERHAIEDAILLRRTGGTFMGLAVLEHLASTRAVTFSTAALAQELDQLYADKKVLEKIGATCTAMFLGGKTLSDRIAQHWPLVPECATCPSDETLAKVVTQGEAEDAIIWLLLHATRVGPCVVDAEGGLRRALLVQDGPESIVWVALTTPGNGDGLTWTAERMPAEHSSAKEAVKAHDSWAGLSEQTRVDMATAILQRQLPSWQGTSTFTL